MTLYHIQDLGHKTPKSCEYTMKFDYSPVAYTGQFWIQENRILECTHCALHCHGTNVSNHLKGKLHRFYQRFILQKTSSIKHPHNCSGVHQNTKLLSGRFPVLQKVVIWSKFLRLALLHLSFGGNFLPISKVRSAFLKWIFPSWLIMNGFMKTRPNLYIIRSF